MTDAEGSGGGRKHHGRPGPATAGGTRLTYTLATIALAVVEMFVYRVCFRNTREAVPLRGSAARLP